MTALPLGWRCRPVVYPAHLFYVSRVGPTRPYSDFSGRPLLPTRESQTEPNRSISCGLGAAQQASPYSPPGRARRRSWHPIGESRFETNFPGQRGPSDSERKTSAKILITTCPPRVRPNAAPWSKNFESAEHSPPQNRPTTCNFHCCCSKKTRANSCVYM
jgi:hypothetical protein